MVLGSSLGFSLDICVSFPHSLDNLSRNGCTGRFHKKEGLAASWSGYWSLHCGRAGPDVGFRLLLARSQSSTVGYRHAAVVRTLFHELAVAVCSAMEWPIPRRERGVWRDG